MSEEYRNKRLKIFVHPDVSLTAIEASGTKVITKEYGELVDLESGCWAAVLGHSNKEIIDTMIQTAPKLFHLHQFFDTEYPDALVEELTKAAHLPCSYKGTFMTSGTEAVSLAVTLAELITGRNKKLSFSISYHGAIPGLRIPRDQSQWVDLDINECLTCTNCSQCKACGKFHDVDFSEISAFVFDAGNSKGLVLCPPEKLIMYLKDEIRSHGGLIIANEVTTGFGRTGKWFGFQHYNCLNTKTDSPDFIALGKGIGNGYPISGVLIRDELTEAILHTGYSYVQSHSDDPLGCAVARKVVEVIARENLIEHGNQMGTYLCSKLEDVKMRTNGIDEVRGRGLMISVTFKPSTPVKEVIIKLLNKGFFAGYSELYNYLHFYAPLTISKSEIDALCDSLEEILV